MASEGSQVEFDYYGIPLPLAVLPRVPTVRGLAIAAPMGRSSCGICRTAALKATLEAHAGCVRAATGSNNHLISGSHDRTVKVWDTSTAACTAALTWHTHVVSSVAALPGAGRIASGSWDKTVRLWDLQAGSCSHTISHQSPVYDVAAVSESVIASTDCDTVQLSGHPDGGLRAQPRWTHRLGLLCGVPGRGRLRASQQLQ